MRMYKHTTAYMKHLILRHKTLLLLYTFVCFICYPLLTILTENPYIDDLMAIGGTIYLIGLLIAFLILPVLVFRFNHNKRSVDTYYSLPISRSSLFFAQYLTPMLCALIPVILNYALGTIILTIRATINNYTWWGGPGGTFEAFVVFVLALIPLVAAYAMNTYFVNKSNTMFDAAIVTLGHNVLPFLIILAVALFIDNHRVSTGSIDYDYFLISRILSPNYRCFDLYISYFDNRITMDFDLLLKTLYNIGFFVLFTVLGVKAFKKRKGEDAEQITNSFITYPFLIHVASIFIMSFLDITEMWSETVVVILFIAILFVIFTIMNFIANRSVKFTWKILAKFVILLVGFTCFNYVARETELFGLNRQHVDMSDKAKVEVRYYYYPEGKDGQYQCVETLLVGVHDERIEEIQNLQDLASEQHKEGIYGWDHPYARSNEMIEINVRYWDEPERNRVYRNYRFLMDDIKDILDDIEFTFESWNQEYDEDGNVIVDLEIDSISTSTMIQE